MKYKVTLKLRDGGEKVFSITAKTDLSIRMKTNQLTERAGIKEEEVIDTIVEEVGEPDD